MNQEVGGGSGEECRVAGIHFWRPLLPGFHDVPKKLDSQIKKIKDAGAVSSVAVGLKVSKRLADKIKAQASITTVMRIISLGL